MINPLDPAALKNARAYAGLIGEIPSSFTAATRTLAQDPAPDCTELQGPGAFLAQRLLKTGTIKSALAFAAATFKPEKYPSAAAVKPLSVLADYRPLDLGAVLGLIYIYRKARSICPSDEWPYIDAALSRLLDVAMHVGYALPNAGVAAGVFTGGYCVLGQAMFLKHDARGYRDYRRHLKTNNVPFDLDFERSRWQCTSVQVAACFVQLLGLGVPLAEAFNVGLSAVHPDGDGLDEAAYRFFIINRWTRSILTTGEIPDITHRGQYYPLKTDLDRLKELTAGAQTTGSRHRWLEKTKDDLPVPSTLAAESTPPGDALAEIAAAVAADQK